MDEINEFQEEQNLARKLKPFLRFKVGDLVSLKSNRDVTMVVRSLVSPIPAYDPEDYVCEWLNSRLEVERDLFFDQTLDSAT